MSVNDVPGWLVTLVPSAIGEPVAFTPGLAPHHDVLAVVLPLLAAPLLGVAVEGCGGLPGWAGGANLKCLVRKYKAWHSAPDGNGLIWWQHLKALRIELWVCARIWHAEPHD
jgi:hypothetical protein